MRDDGGVDRARRADGLAGRRALGDEHELAVAGADRVDGDERRAGSAPAVSAGRTSMSETARSDSVLTVATAWPMTRQTIIGVS